MSLIDSLESILFVSSPSIGDIQLSVVVKEEHHDEMTITEHPVESSANISDHAFLRPKEVIIECGWGNSLLGDIASVGSGLISNGVPTTSDVVGGVYAQLLALQESRTPFSVMTSKRQYQNMLIASLTNITDPETYAVLKVEAKLREVILVSTQSTTLPSMANQADPSSTAETVSTGMKAPVPATPSPGGALAIPTQLA